MNEDGSSCNCTMRIAFPDMSDTNKANYLLREFDKICEMKAKMNYFVLIQNDILLLTHIKESRICTSILYICSILLFI
jgi:hypothetical protein